MNYLQKKIDRVTELEKQVQILRGKRFSSSDRDEILELSNQLIDHLNLIKNLEIDIRNELTD